MKADRNTSSGNLKELFPWRKYLDTWYEIASEKNILRYTKNFQIGSADKQQHDHSDHSQK